MFVNNTAAIAMFIPVAVQIAKQHRRSPSKLLLPLNYVAIVGGTCTLIGTSTNILVSSLAQARGRARLHDVRVPSARHHLLR